MNSVNKNKTVAMFGSSRTPRTSYLWSNVVQAAEYMTQRGWTVATGGGSGLMQAAMSGAIEGGKMWLAKHTPEEDHPLVSGLTYSDHMQPSSLMLPRTASELEAETYYTRLDTMLDCDAFIAMSGGYGTLLELVQVCQAIQMKRIPRKPLYVCGKSLNNTFQRFMHDCRVGDYIDADEIFHTYVDYPTEAATNLCALKQFVEIPDYLR